MGQILRLQRLTPFPLRMTGGVVKIPPGLYPFDYDGSALLHRLRSG